MKPIFPLITLHHSFHAKTVKNTKITWKVCLLALVLLMQVFLSLNAQNTNEAAHSILPADGIIQYLPKDTTAATTPAILSTNKLQFTPQINFYFLPEGTLNYKGAGLAVDTGHRSFESVRHRITYCGKINIGVLATSTHLKARIYRPQPELPVFDLCV
jgi:hypothetical protein